MVVQTVKTWISIFQFQSLSLIPFLPLFTTWMEFFFQYNSYVNVEFIPHNNI